MYKHKSILAIIPARGASKGLPNKNIMPFAGKPLIAWSIGEAKESAYLDEVAVSTDSEAIARVASRYGLPVPFLRPKALSGGRSSAVDAVLHAIRFFEKIGKQFDIFVLLQPTSPLRISCDIDKAIELLFSKKAKVIISVAQTNPTPLWSNILPKSGSMRGFLSPMANRPRQELERYFHPNGALFVGFVERLKSERSLYGDRTFAYVMPGERSVDIDNAVEFELAQLLFKRRRDKGM